VSKIKAHKSKIYGIDWSHDVRNEIVTCSLDKTIKVWDINDSTNSEEVVEPTASIQTTYPVWRARNLPFGRGLLSLAQRGVTGLEMYAQYQSHAPVETFEGHTDVVKEFVWRKGGQGESRFCHY
jgi:WD40 repeat protein